MRLTDTVDSLLTYWKNDGMKSKSPARLFSSQTWSLYLGAGGTTVGLFFNMYNHSISRRHPSFVLILIEMYAPQKKDVAVVADPQQL